MLETKDILETINMIDNENLDVRTITMGISLLDCIDEDIDKACTKVYDKICRSAKDLVKTGEDIQREYGIPIIHKRISVTPIGMVAAPCQSKKVVKFAYALDKAAKELGVNFVGGYVFPIRFSRRHLITSFRWYIGFAVSGCGEESRTPIWR